jgi:serine/threonine protein kinase
VCQCSAFFTGETCDELSNITIVVITLVGALGLVVFILFYNYRVSRGKKSQVLEELRQGLLYDNENGTGNNLDNINEAYIQSLQQGLILKDVSVKFKEIDIEKQVGEGSFGVVYKATFRGASVAVKRMRPVFTELTNKDIEEFNKEAYMMSRLRHPNIVLVMGISYVEPEIMKFPKKSRFNQGEQDDEDDNFLNKDSPKDKGPLQKTVCIVTEYLEQGSLADILYGPQRLPAEVWTYDLILTCALQAARGMLYLHSHSPPICHRDLKSSNLVVDDHWVVKVTDFGMSRIIPDKVIEIEAGAREVKTDEDRALQKRLERERISNAPDFAGRESFGGGSDLSGHHDFEGDSSSSEQSNSKHSDKALPAVSVPEPIDISKPRRGKGKKSGPGKDRNGQEMTSNLGTTAWCAPELLTTSSKARYSVKVDVYSFGMVLWELWERKRPYEELASRFDIMDAIRSGTRPTISSSCPPALMSLIQRCWQGDPSRRPMFQYIVRYLKDELARVRRSRERMSSVDTRGSNSAFNPMGPGGMLPQVSSPMHREESALTRFAGNLTSMIPGLGAPASPEPQVTDYRRSGGISIPEQGDGRAALFANPDINYLAASPAVNQSSMQRLGNSSMFAGQAQQKPYNPPAPIAQEARGPRQQQQQQQQQQQGAPGPNFGPRSSARDKYVMKMSGWQPSQPDAGLPPSATGAGGGGTAFSRSLESNSYLQNKTQEETDGTDDQGRFFGDMEGGDDGDGSLAGSPPKQGSNNGRLPSNHEEY